MRRSNTYNFIFLLYVLSAFFCDVIAKDYVVDKKNIYCNDETGKPFCSLSAAIAVSQAEDIIYLYPNRHVGSFKIEHSLSLIAVNNVPPVLDGNQINAVIHILPNAHVRMQGIIVENGHAEKGAGILNQGSLVLIDSVVRYNRAKYSGGGIYNGGARSTKLHIINSRILHNHALGDDKYNIKYGGGGIYNDAELQIANSILSGNRAVNNGGAIYSVFSSRTIASAGERAAESMGIATSPKRAKSLNRKQDTNSVTLHKVRMQLNEANAGGGINLHGVMKITDSFIDSNKAVTNRFSSGGGIYAHMDTFLTVINSTISRNTAKYSGGGIRFYSTNSGELYNVSIVDNKVDIQGQGAGLYIVGLNKKFSVANSIIARNSKVNNKASDCDGEITSMGYNFVGYTDQCRWQDSTGDILGRDQGRLEPGLIWQKNKQRYILALDSIAKNRGNPAGCRDENNKLIRHDQYGKPRDSRCDIGSIEYTGLEYRS